MSATARPPMRSEERKAFVEKHGLADGIRRRSAEAPPLPEVAISILRATNCPIPRRREAGAA